MWVFERDAVVPADETDLEFGRKRGQVGSVLRVLLRCVKQDEEEEINRDEEQASPGLDRELWNRLPRDLASRIVFQHAPLRIRLQQGWPATHLINFPPLEKHALFVGGMFVGGKIAFHNFSSRRRRVEIPGEFSSAQPLALSDRGLLVVACFSGRIKAQVFGMLPPSNQLPLLDHQPPGFPTGEVPGELPQAGQQNVCSRLPPEEARARSIHLDPGPGGSPLHLQLRTRDFTEAPPSSEMYYASRILLTETNTIPDLMLPRPMLELIGVAIQGLDKRFKFRYSVCMSSEKDGGGEPDVMLMCCMRLDTLTGDWEVMPGPPRSILRELNLYWMFALGGEFEEGIAVFEDFHNQRLLLGFVEPWEWVLSTNIITLSDQGSCNRGSMQLLVPS